MIADNKLIYSKMKANCAFQYYTSGLWDSKMVEDVTGITLKEAKALFNKHYNHMLQRAINEDDFEVAIWVDMDHESDYRKSLIHLQNPEYENGCLVEKTVKRFRRFSGV